MTLGTTLQLLNIRPGKAFYKLLEDKKRRDKAALRPSDLP